MKAVVTGGAGFIGSHLTKKLLNDGYEVIVIDDLSTGSLDNLSEIIDDITFVEGSILDLDFLRDYFKGVDYVFHLAAVASVPKSIEDPIYSHKVNVDGTLNILKLSKDNSVKRFVYAASASRYGDGKETIKTEDLPTSPLSPYALQKLIGEHYCKLFSNIYDLETVSCIFFNVFGPNQDPNSPYSAVIPKFVSQMLRGQSPTIYGDGTTSRDFTYVDNNVQAMILAATTDGVSGQAFNIGLGSAISLNELIEKINNYLNAKIEPVFEDFKTGDIKHSLSSIDKAKHKLKYQPDNNFDEGLKITIESLKK